MIAELSQYIDPLIVAIFLAVALPGIALTAVFNTEKPISQRLFDRDASGNTSEGQSAAYAKRNEIVDVRKEMPASRFGIVGNLMNRLPIDANRMNIRILNSGLNLNAGDLILISILLSIVTFFVLNAFAGLHFLILVLPSLFAGLAFPQIHLNMCAKKRHRKFLAEFPDALDLIVRGIRSGLPVTDAIRSIGSEFHGPTGEIFETIQSKMAIGHSLEEALWTTAVQMPLSEFRFFIIALTIQQETGGNLGEILQKLSTIIRKRQQLRLKIRAMSSEARASAMIIGCLPFVMMAILYVVNSEYILVLFTDPRGNMLLGGGALMLTTGVGLMVKMSKFQI